MKTRKYKKSIRLKTRRIKGGLQIKSRTQALNILELPNNASKANIKKQHRKLALIHHPDKGGDDEKFKKIQVAYDYLIGANNRVEHEAEPREADYKSQAPRAHYEPPYEERSKESRKYNKERHSKFDEHDILMVYITSYQNFLDNEPEKSLAGYYDSTIYRYSTISETKTPVLFTGSKIYKLLDKTSYHGIKRSQARKRSGESEIDVDDMNFYKLYKSDKNFKHFMDYSAQVEILLDKMNSKYTDYGYEGIKEEQMAEHGRLVLESFMEFIKDAPIFMYVYNNFKKYYDMFNYQNTFGIKNKLPTHVVKVYDLMHKKEYILEQEPEGKNVNMSGTEDEFPDL